MQAQRVTSILKQLCIQKLKKSCKKLTGHTALKSKVLYLEAVYTQLINIFSKYNPPKQTETFQTTPKTKQGIFEVIDEISIGKLKLQVLNGLGGHVNGQVYFFCENEGFLFTADSLINFESLTPERERYNTLAKLLMTTVNVDSEAAKKERDGLLSIAKKANGSLKRKNRNCLICSGHGAISVLRRKHPYYTR